VFGVSERRACRVTGQQRTTQRHARRVLAPEEALRARLREIASGGDAGELAGRAGAARGTITLIGRSAGRPHPVLDRLNRVA
jgi:hypothetical protein